MAWELLYGLGALALLAALVWGMARYKSRNRANDAVSETATREEYDRPDRYGAEEEAFRAELKP